MSLHIGMDKHGVRWKDRGKLLAFSGQTKIRFQSIAGEKGGCFQENLDSDF